MPKIPMCQRLQVILGAGVQEAGAVLLLLHPAAAGQWLRWHPLSHPGCGLALQTAFVLDSCCVLISSPASASGPAQQGQRKHSSSKRTAKSRAPVYGAWNLQHQPRMDCQPCAAVHGGSARGALAARTRQAFIPIDSRIGRTAAACAPASATAHDRPAATRGTVLCSLAAP